ncbi:uncharacterized protein LOC132032121 [Lycium ferocissimum]|uniref:uncharacterized protein LOC132032121 n=1 Tax=Lycium ferocissimum TaxID=112874 RepID=UPI00281541E8|nr:uncharacterized protein LOC132032121 [Lycium ferocissimum]
MNEEKEIELLFNQLVEGRNINELDSREIKGFLKATAAKMDKINDRKKILNQQYQPSQPPNSPPPPPPNFKFGNGNVTPSASPMEYLINDPWFVETMATNQNDLGLRVGSPTEPAPTKGSDINAKDDGNSKDLD